MKRLRPYIPALAIVILLVIALVATSGSGLVAKKVVAMLILPSGAIWLALLALVFWPGFKRSMRVILSLIWIVYTLAGNSYVGIALLKQLEKPYYSYEIPIETLDVLVLLGGGTVETPSGGPALGTHGDRVLRPAMLYHQGKVKHLVTTGRSVTEAKKDRILSRETSLIWQSLGIPESAITEVPDPRTTSEELKAVAKLLQENPQWEKIGLSSSASHLNRAMMEARRQGLEPIPVPSDFRSVDLFISPLYLIPQGRGFRDVQTALWEILGRLS